MFIKGDNNKVRTAYNKNNNKQQSIGAIKPQGSKKMKQSINTLGRLPSTRTIKSGGKTTHNVSIRYVENCPEGKFIISLYPLLAGCSSEHYFYKQLDKALAFFYGVTS